MSGQSGICLRVFLGIIKFLLVQEESQIRNHSAVDDELRAGRIARIIGCKVDDQVGNFLRFRGPSQWNILFQLFDVLIDVALFSHRRFDDARVYGIHADVERTKLRSGAFRHPG